jgi:hypothetical protein
MNRFKVLSRLHHFSPPVPRRKKWRAAILALLLILTLPLTIFFPIMTVKGLVKSSGITNFQGPFSMDEGRIAVTDGASHYFVYDLVSGLKITLQPPVGTVFGFQPTIYGDKLVIETGTSIASPTTLYYCVLTRTGCGAWTQIATAASWVYLSSHGFPSLKADILVWPVAGGFDYYRFSSGTTTFVATPTDARTPSTNGEIIAFSAKPTLTSLSNTLMYYETSPVGAIVDTGFPVANMVSIAQNTVAFEDNTTLPTCVSGNFTSCDYRIRYYDILRNQASPAGTGPEGFLPFSQQAVWGDRIVFSITESTLNFDCNGNGGFFSGNITTTGLIPDACVRWWNIRSPTLALFTDPSAAPSGESPQIYDKTLAFVHRAFNPITGSFSSTIDYVTLPMHGDINQDGLVNIDDFSAAGGCFGQTIKGSSTC